MCYIDERILLQNMTDYVEVSSGLQVHIVPHRVCANLQREKCTRVFWELCVRWTSGLSPSQVCVEVQGVEYARVCLEQPEIAARSVTQQVVAR